MGAPARLLDRLLNGRWQRQAYPPLALHQTMHFDRTELDCTYNFLGRREAQELTSERSRGTSRCTCSAALY